MGGATLSGESINRTGGAHRVIEIKARGIRHTSSPLAALKTRGLQAWKEVASGSGGWSWLTASRKMGPQLFKGPEQDSAKHPKKPEAEAPKRKADLISTPEHRASWACLAQTRQPVC